MGRKTVVDNFFFHRVSPDLSTAFRKFFYRFFKYKWDKNESKKFRFEKIAGNIPPELKGIRGLGRKTVVVTTRPGDQYRVTL